MGRYLRTIKETKSGRVTRTGPTPAAAAPAPPPERGRTAVAGRTGVRATFAAFAVVVALAVGAVVPGPRPAAAQDGGAYSETTNIDLDECFSDPPVEFCLKEKGVYHMTVQPDGDLITRANTHYTFVIRVAGVEAERQSGQNHFSSHTRDGEAQVQNVNAKYEQTVGGRTVECRVMYQFANGEFRVERVDCT